MLVKIIKLVKNGGSLYVRQVCKYKWLGGGVEGWQQAQVGPRGFVSNHLDSSSCDRQASNMCSMSLSNSFDHLLMLCMECGIAKED